MICVHGPPTGTRSRGTFVTPGADGLPDTGDPEADREAQRWRQGETWRAVRDYAPYDPSFETPDEGGINGPPDRALIRTRVKASRPQLAVSKPAQSLLEPELGRAPICAAGHGRPRPSVDLSQLTGSPLLKHRSLARDPWSLSSLRCAFECSVEAQHRSTASAAKLCSGLFA
jgi:hypothetical protein